MNNEEFMQQVEKLYAFHTKRAPGIPIAAQMVYLALEKLGDAKKICAVAETQVCLSDSIQVLTGCTLGNKYLISHNEIGRYALTLYDRKNGNGIRVYVDLAKIDPEKMPETSLFFRRKRPKHLLTDMVARKASADKVVQEFLDNNRDIFSWQAVHVADHQKPPVFPANICEKCNESFLTEDSSATVCKACSGEIAYYTIRN